MFAILFIFYLRALYLLWQGLMRVRKLFLFPALLWFRGFTYHFLSFSCMLCFVVWADGDMGFMNGFCYSNLPIGGYGRVFFLSLNRFYTHIAAEELFIGFIVSYFGV